MEDITNQSKTVGIFFVVSNADMVFKKRAKNFLALGVKKSSKKYLHKLGKPSLMCSAQNPVPPVTTTETKIAELVVQN